MIDINQIVSFYPENLKPFKRNLLREYFQYKMLDIIFDSDFGGRLVFLGGTALRIVYSNKRFSEDLDFDNLALEERDFENLTNLIKRNLELEGYNIEIKSKFGDVYNSNISILGVLFENNLSNHPEEKLVIQLQTEPQKFEYEEELKILNKFDVFLHIKVVPVDLLLSQKINAIFTRPRALGRDFYDVVFLLGRTKPNIEYLKKKLNIKDFNQLKDKLLLKCEGIDFEHLARDVESFLFDPRDTKRVRNFYDYIKNYHF
ncbi:nucleotidyl transferase AbiEii/AbiGii toxin family protein [candidate division WOR-3 bacterium]|nr:nucleotidyl transferase AbiEii/AbiGii toxin family protein [candidate division WOR-3 bacterium]